MVAAAGVANAFVAVNLYPTLAPWSSQQRRRCGGQCSLRLVNTGLEDDPKVVMSEVEFASGEEVELVLEGEVEAFEEVDFADFEVAEIDHLGNVQLSFPGEGNHGEGAHLHIYHV